MKTRQKAIHCAASRLTAERHRVDVFKKEVENRYGPLPEDDRPLEIIDPKELTMLEDDPGTTKFDARLKVPDEIAARIDALDRLEAWEREAWSLCAAFDNACRHWPGTKNAEAEAIGKFIASQLMNGNRAALGIVEEGLKNLSAGKKFRPVAGKQPSKPERITVVVAFYELEASGTHEPATCEVKAWIHKSLGIVIPLYRISKISDELHLRVGDARDTRTKAGQRKRKLRHVANQVG